MRFASRLITLCALLVACGGGESRVSAPETPGPTTPPPGGGVLRTTLSVTVTPESPDVLIARTLGWPDAIPGATVVLRREGGADVTAQSNAQGVVAFADLVEGNYQITVSRAFTTVELGKLAAADRDYSAWGGARSVSISNAGGSLAFEVTVAAARRGSLVFAEVLSDAYITFQPNGTMYNFSGYAEIYNNSDTTITVDGMLLANAEYVPGAYSTLHCTISAHLYNDPAGVWADIIYQLPPVGRRLKPGEFVVIAIDAIDHRAFGTRDVYDLSKADYEVYAGLGDVDNPAVPNLVSVGTATSHSALRGRGESFLSYNNAYVLTMPLDVESLRRAANTAQNHDYLLLPAAAVLDVISVVSVNAGAAPCATPLAANLDAAPLELQVTTLSGTSFQRSQLPGTSYLKRSRSSARDYSILTATPFSIP